MRTTLYRGELFYFVADPLQGLETSYCYEADGGLLVDEYGKVAGSGTYASLAAAYPDVPVVDYSGSLIMPGLIDTHLHYVQTEIIGMYGKQLLDWLNLYTFPAEEAFASRDHARSIARLFLQELLRNGTTCCMAYSSVHALSAEALFDEASRLNMAVFTGKTLMDRNAPEKLLDTVSRAEAESRRLIETWHGKGRNRYVVTPRFAITSTPDELRMAGQLLRDYPGVYMQTHLSENRKELETVSALFPDEADYLAVYERYGLLTDRSVFGHCVHLTPREYRRLHETGAVVAHCPTSNAFLGSGCYPMEEANRWGLQTTLATDVGAGTSFSMFRTLDAAYKIQQLQGYVMSPFEAFYKATLGSARALQVDQEIGTFLPGRTADFIVLDYSSTGLQELRKRRLEKTGQWTLENRLFGLQTLADDRAVRFVYLAGKQV